MPSYPPAYIYGRYSSDRQEEGDSKQRQLRGGRAFADRHEIKVKGEFFDEGVSAKAGKNLERQFASMLAKLKVGEGIIVEDLDRVSRMHPWLVKAKIYEILADGHYIGTHLGGDKFYTIENIEEAETFLIGDLKSGVAYLENAKKRARQKSLINTAEKEIQTGKKVDIIRPPGWLRYEDGQYIKVPERIRSLAKIFQLADSGMGSVAIARKMVADKEAVIAFRKRAGTRWNDAYVRHLLRSKLPIGTLTFRGKDYPNYYPVIVDTDQWDRVQHKIAIWAAPKGRPSKRLNIFSGLLKCAICHASVNLAGGKRRYRLYVCERARIGDGCEYKVWRDDYLERIFLENLIFSDAFMQSMGEKREDKLSSLYGKRDRLKKDIDTLTDRIIEGGQTKALAARQRQYEDELEAVEVAIEDEEIRVKASTPSKETYSEIRKLVSEDIANPSTRERVRNALRDLVQKIELNIPNTAIHIHLRHSPFIHDVKYANTKGENPIESRRLVEA